MTRHLMLPLFLLSNLYNCLIAPTHEKSYLPHRLLYNSSLIHLIGPPTMYIFVGTVRAIAIL
ncbi:unnamed protein product [Cuscuta europaea]|uniref:Uncharacterized protein n=1 Tax=Cuscuta europaea TaxID=41803 RepID=A0A9P0ZI85_CUSEU|nr:unnamed protein product [Cuscuta europaea]